ncbi:hypothetical protein MY11210_008064 [Beauveria gryllotalpidicola]
MRSIVFNCFLGLLARGAFVAALQAPGQDAMPPREPKEMENPPEELLALHRKLHDASLASGQVCVHDVTGTQLDQDRAS